MPINRQTSRRDFLRYTSALGFAGSLGATSALQLGFVRQASAMPFNDYKAMVCILLAGGNDSFNMLVPNDADQYGEYAAIRSDLALQQSDLLPLSGTHQGRNYAVHPAMGGVRDLYDAGEVAILANVGPLVDYTDAAGVAAGAQTPLGVFSHADQIQAWQTSTADARIAQGWAGRLADLMETQEVNPANGISMNISLSGTNVFQSGNVVSPYAVDTSDEGAPGISNYGGLDDFGLFRTRMIDDMLALQHTNLLRQEYSQRLRGALDARDVFVAALAGGTPVTTSFSDNMFSQALRQIARIIGARGGLGVSRQTFFVTVGGWDHHDDVLDNQAEMLPMINSGLVEFRDALVDLGLYQDVATFTTSDFGRTLTSNGKGSDHGWGGNHLIMGGAVDGGQFFGSYPEISMSSPLDVGRGVFVPTTSVEEYFTDLALWFGLSPNDLDIVLPNVRTFYDPASATPPLGLMV